MMKKIIMIVTLMGGMLYANGVSEGMRALKSGDYSNAMAHFQEEAAHGDKIAQQNLGVMYNNGLGVSRDVNKAMYWFKLAATDVAIASTVASN